MDDGKKFAVCPFFLNARNYLTDDPSNDPALVEDITKKITSFIKLKIIWSLPFLFFCARNSRLPLP